MAQVSRASVTKWCKNRTLEWINVETKTVIQLSNSLNVSPAYFLTPTENLEKYYVTFLWDFLYPDVHYFLIALRHKEIPAVARLVQTLGFRQSISLMGQWVIERFDDYVQFIHPLRRKELEILRKHYC